MIEEFQGDGKPIVISQDAVDTLGRSMWATLTLCVINRETKPGCVPLVAPDLGWETIDETIRVFYRYAAFESLRLAACMGGKLVELQGVSPTPPWRENFTLAMPTIPGLEADAILSALTSKPHSWS
jgi:hypothetical protein